MQLYDFAFYAKRRDALQLAKKVQAMKSTLNEPGKVQELKTHITEYVAIINAR